MTLVGVGNRLSAVGASQVANVGLPPAVESDGFMYWVWAYLADRFAYYPRVAQGGETVSQTLARVQDATNGYPGLLTTEGAYPGHAVVQMLRNNMISDLPTLIASLQTYEQVLDYLLSIGTLPWVTATLPSSDATSAATHQRNCMYALVGLWLICRRKGLPFLNAIPSIVDTTTGGILSALALDTLHVNDLGAKAFGQSVANKMLAPGIGYPLDLPLAYSNDANTDDALLLANPLMLAGSGTPTNWTKAGADSANLTVSQPDGTSDGILGNWMRLVKATTAGDSYVQSSTMTVAAGDKVFAGWVEEYDWASGTAGAEIRIRTSPGNTDLVVRTINAASQQDTPIQRVGRILTIPASQTGIFMRAHVQSLAEFNVGQVTFVNLTASGLAALL